MPKQSHEDIAGESLRNAPDTAEAARAERAYAAEQESYEHRLDAAEEDYIDDMIDGYGLLE